MLNSGQERQQLATHRFEMCKQHLNYLSSNNYSGDSVFYFKIKLVIQYSCYGYQPILGPDDVTRVRQYARCAGTTRMWPNSTLLAGI